MDNIISALIDSGLVSPAKGTIFANAKNDIQAIDNQLNSLYGHPLRFQRQIMNLEESRKVITNVLR